MWVQSLSNSLFPNPSRGSLLDAAHAADPAGAHLDAALALDFNQVARGLGSIFATSRCGLAETIASGVWRSRGHALARPQVGLARCGHSIPLQPPRAGRAQRAFHGGGGRGGGRVDRLIGGSGRGRRSFDFVSRRIGSHSSRSSGRRRGCLHFVSLFVGHACRIIVSRRRGSSCLGRWLGGRGRGRRQQRAQGGRRRGLGGGRFGRRRRRFGRGFGGGGNRGRLGSRRRRLGSRRGRVSRVGASIHRVCVRRRGRGGSGRFGRRGRSRRFGGRRRGRLRWRRRRRVSGRRRRRIHSRRRCVSSIVHGGDRGSRGGGAAPPD